jgi:hypothetical protein
VNESSGYLAFDTLIANGKLYKINAASAPIPGKLRQDLEDLQNRRDTRDYLKTDIKERREMARGSAARSYSNAADSIVSNFLRELKERESVTEIPYSFLCQYLQESYYFAIP